MSIPDTSEPSLNSGDDDSSRLTSVTVTGALLDAALASLALDGETTWARSLQCGYEPSEARLSSARPTRKSSSRSDGPEDPAGTRKATWATRAPWPSG
jgi:hypothetical protein